MPWTPPSVAAGDTPAPAPKKGAWTPPSAVKAPTFDPISLKDVKNAVGLQDQRPPLARVAGFSLESGDPASHGAPRSGLPQIPGGIPNVDVPAGGNVPQQRGIMARTAEGASAGFGESKVTPEEQQNYPNISKVAQLLEMPGRVLGAGAGAAVGAATGAAEKVGGMLPAEADRLMRDLGIGAVAVGTEGGMGPRGLDAPRTVPKKGGAPKPKPTSPEAIASGITQGETHDPSAITGPVERRAQGAKAFVGAVEKGVDLDIKALRGIVEDQNKAIEDAMRARGQETPTRGDLGEQVTEATKDKRLAAKGETANKYREAYGTPGEFSPGEFYALGAKLRATLDPTLVVDDRLTPNASRLIQDIDHNISQLEIQNRAAKGPKPDPETMVGINMRGVEQVRKRLNSYMSAAYRSGVDEDIRATRGLINAFDKHVEDTVANGLFSGDPKVLDMLKAARKSSSENRKLFGPREAGDDAGIAVRKITERNATADEVANMLLGAGKIGSAGLPVRIFERMENIHGPNSPVMSTIRAEIWKKASKDGWKGIEALVDSSLGKKAFTAEELKFMRDHAAGARELEAVATALPARTAMVREAYERVFAGKELGGRQGTIFRKLVEGTATGEEVKEVLFDAINTNRASDVVRMVKAIDRIVGHDSEVMHQTKLGMWEKLTQNPDPLAVVEQLKGFLDGKGAPIARELFDARETTLMRRYITELQKPPGLRQRLGEMKANVAGAVLGVALRSIIPGGPAIKQAAQFVGRRAGQHYADEIRRGAKHGVTVKPYGGPVE